MQKELPLFHLYTYNVTYSQALIRAWIFLGVHFPAPRRDLHNESLGRTWWLQESTSTLVLLPDQCFFNLRNIQIHLKRKSIVGAQGHVHWPSTWECAESYLSAERTPTLRCCSVTYMETQMPRSRNRAVARQLFRQSRSYSTLVFFRLSSNKKGNFL